MSSAPSQLIADRYRLVKPLGQGGMGRVWMARDEVLHRDVAIKELVPPPGLTDEERREMRERSLREARAIARLNHANVIRVFDVLRTDGDPWIVMEYVPSRSLQDVITTEGPLPPAKVVEIGLGVLGALRAAHRAGVMHRDVKPGNVLLGTDGRVVLTDFGLATVPGDPSVTRTGLVLGSPAYIAPERARDGTALPEGDLWSLGATLYAAVEGNSPFARPSAIGTLAALATEPVPPAKKAGPLKPVLNGLLRKDPAERLDAEGAERLLRRAARRGRSALLDGVRRPNGRREGQAKDGASARPEKERDSQGTEPAAAAAAAAKVPAPRSAPPAMAPAVPPPVPPAAPPAALPTERVSSPPDGVRGVVFGGGQPERSPRPRRSWLIGGLVAVVLLVLVVVPLVVDRDTGERDRTVDAGASTSAKPAGAAPTGASTTAAPTPSATAEPSGTPAPVVPDGWYLYKDPSGFSVPVPKGWSVQRQRFSPYGPEDVRVYFRDPHSARRLLIDQTTHPLKDAEADWRRQEKRRRGGYANYKLVVIQKVDYWDEAADWEWIFTDDGVRLHVRNRGFVTAKDKGYAIRWDTPEEDWAENLKNFDIIAAGFRPVRS